jgi:transposase-like protein
MATPKTLQEAIQHFTDYDNCRQFMVSVLWLDGVVRCPYCKSEKVTYLAKARVYRCYGDHAKQKFSLKVGTIFEDSAIGLDKWLPAVWFVVNCKNGISSYELHRALGVTQKTAWFMTHRIRLAMQSKSFAKFGGPDTEVEVDETFIGGKAKNMHKSRKLRINQARAQVRDADATIASRYLAKTPVQGILDRAQRKVRATVVPNVKRKTLQQRILSEVESGSSVYTDQAISYEAALAKDFVHEMVNHVEGYVNGRIHTNGLENFWSLLKRSLNGTYVAVEPFHLFRYLDEQTFRYNNRATKDNPLTDADRFHLAMTQIAGKRLTYSELTGKDWQEKF